ncbi:MAG: hypothetical protein QNJ63_23155 [Calothrix sp. MO_192.B10]|nr:hypothetical protein [Calothrix sp. MO_192.B10]
MEDNWDWEVRKMQSISFSPSLVQTIDYDQTAIGVKTPNFVVVEKYFSYSSRVNLPMGKLITDN